MEPVLLILNVLNAAALIVLALLVFRRKEKNPEEETERKLQQMTEQIRRDVQSGFSDGRRESGQNANAQMTLLQNSFTEYMKFLLQFRDAVGNAQADTAEKLARGQKEMSERNEAKFSELVKSITEENGKFRREQLENQARFQQLLNQQMEQNRNQMDQRLKDIQTENSQKLDAMKKTVDEKLQESMDRHFTESFKLISERLEQVHKGLGEMQTLAAGVGDLKKVLTNVKTRGNLGEIQLSAILEQYLAPDQYAANVSTVPGSSEVVEFAIRMPGKHDEEPVFLPVDSKFPVEDYDRLLETYEQFPRMSPEVKKAQESFARTVRKSAGDIRTKYLYPPKTTPFGIMFVPSEGIYAEILRIPGLFEQLQNEYKIAVAGPSNLVAFLNSLQFGFKTLAIEKRSGEVWQILGAVKTEFQKFGEVMDSARKSLQTVCNHVDRIGTRSRALERKLRDVQALPQEAAARILPPEKETGSEENTDGEGAV